MCPIRLPRVRAGLALAALLMAAGCQSAPPQNRRTVEPSQAISTPAPTIDERATSRREVRSVSYQEPLPPPDTAALDPIDRGQQLAQEQLVAEVLARNPSIEAMVAAWRAAAQRYPQAVSLEDPMFGTLLAPGAWGSEELEGGYMLDASQQIPWPGKRATRGRSARAEATAARFEIEDTRLRIAQAARLAFIDFYLARRYFELNEENLRAVREFRETARQRYETNLVPQQDLLQADVEVAELQRRELELRRMERVAIARINTLLLRLPDLPLPPPPATLGMPADSYDADALRQQALARRPDLAAQAARIRVEQAEWALARLDYYPDFEVVGRYDTFWQEEPLRSQVGMNLNVPIYKAKRDAAVREAMFQVQQRRAEYDELVLDISNEVQAVYEQLVESKQTVELYRTRIIPAARQNVESARTSYVTGVLDFLRLIDAQRQLIVHLERSLEAEANYNRRLADLERVIGGRLPPAVSPEPVPAPNP